MVSLLGTLASLCVSFLTSFLIFSFCERHTWREVVRWEEFCIASWPVGGMPWVRRPALVPLQASPGQTAA